MEAEGKKHCLKCLLREMDKDAYFQNLHDYIAGLDEDIKADGELYEDRPVSYTHLTLPTN